MNIEFWQFPFLKRTNFSSNFWLPFYDNTQKKFKNTYTYNTEKHIDKVDFDIWGSMFTFFQLAPHCKNANFSRTYDQLNHSALIADTIHSF